MVNIQTEDEIMSSAWAQLASLGYTKDGKNLEPSPTGVTTINGTSSRNFDSHDGKRYQSGRLVQVDSDTIDDSLRERIQRFSRLDIDPAKKASNHALLAHLAAVHLSASDYGPFDETNIQETRSSFSSPGKMNVTIRERLGKMSRKERRDLLLKSVSPYTCDVDDQQCLDGQMRDTESSRLTFDFEGDDTYTRLKRQFHYGQCRQEAEESLKHPPPSLRSIETKQQQPVPSQVTPRANNPRSTNSVALHVYDLFSNDTLMQLPWGCVCEIGKCFTEVNTALLSLGTGVYHVGVEVNGIEYAYGATSTGGKTGIFSCIPKMSPGYQYRTTIDFGAVPLVRRSWISVPIVSPPQGIKPGILGPTKQSSTSFRLQEEFIDGRQIIKEMVNEYMGIDYDLLRKNCCTFAHDACIRLGVAEDLIPTWFRNLAETGAMTQDLANATFVQPLNKVLSGCDITSSESSLFDRPISPTECESGFEIVARRNATNTKDVVIVIDAQPSNTADDSRIGFVRTPTWAY